MYIGEPKEGTKMLLQPVRKIKKVAVIKSTHKNR